MLSKIFNLRFRIYIEDNQNIIPKPDHEIENDMAEGHIINLLLVEAAPGTGRFNHFEGVFIEPNQQQHQIIDDMLVEEGFNACVKAVKHYIV